MLRFLDEAKQAMHVRPAQLVMIMSQTFFYVPPSFLSSSTSLPLSSLSSLSSETSPPSSPPLSPISKNARDYTQDNATKAASPPSSSAPPTRVYLQYCIKQHEIWTEMRFWEEAFFDSYMLELSKHQQLEKLVLLC